MVFGNLCAASDFIDFNISLARGQSLKVDKSASRLCDVSNYDWPIDSDIHVLSNKSPATQMYMYIDSNIQKH